MQHHLVVAPQEKKRNTSFFHSGGELALRRVNQVVRWIAKPENRPIGHQQTIDPKPRHPVPLHGVGVSVDPLDMHTQQSFSRSLSDCLPLPLLLLPLHCRAHGFLSILQLEDLVSDGDVQVTIRRI